MITYRFASDKDLEDIISLENSFFGKTSKAPSETKEGLALLLDLGGRILLQEYNRQIVSCVEVIPIKNLQRGKLSLDSIPRNSPLKRLYNSGLFHKLDGDWNFIHGWICISSIGRWAFKKIKQTYNNATLVGLVLKNDQHAIDSYTRFGEIIEGVSNTYSNGENHYLIKFVNIKS